MKSLLFLLCFAFFLSACIGTDIVDDPTVPERLIISPRIDTIQVGETVQFETEFTNKYGQSEETTVFWSSTDHNVVAIDQNGLAEGLAAGPVKIIADAGVASDTLTLNTEGVSNGGGSSRSGTFQGVSSSYSIQGEVSLQANPQGKLQLIFADNFAVSAGPSLYVLLTNHTNGSYTVERGGQVVNGVSAQITMDRMTNFAGMMTFDVPAGVTIDTYKYALLYCTLGPVFGYAELK